MEHEPTAKATFSPARRWFIGLSVVLGVASAVALAAMVNYLGSRHFARINLSERQPITLSPASLRVLHSLTNEVKVTVFFNTRDNEKLHGLVTTLLREYRYANPLVTFKTVDPARQPSEAELVLAAHKLTALKDRNFVVFTCGDHSKVVYESELADFEVDPVTGGPTRQFDKRMATFRGESIFTTLIFNLANPKQFKVCFTQGHGEHDPDNATQPHGYGKFAAVLREKANVVFEKIYLHGTNEIPADCQLLVIAGPRQPYSEAELAKIELFLKQGGRLFALLNNMALGGVSGLETVLAQWDVDIGSRMILDPKNSPTGQDLLVAQMSNEHPITRGLRMDSEDLQPLLVLPRAVGWLRSDRKNPDAPKVEVLAATSENGIEVREIRSGVPYHNPYRDRQGVFPLMVAVEQGNVKGVSAERGLTRIVVVGDSLFLDNELIDTPPANHYFAALAVNWLLDRPQIALEGLVALPVSNYRLIMTEQQLQTTQWLLLAGLPGTALLFGTVVWWRRRH